MADLVVWGRRPPPLGGVTRCVEALVAALSRQSVDHVVVDWRERAALLTVLTERKAVHVHNVSSVLRLLFVVAARFVSGAHTVVYFHSGTLFAQIRSPLRRAIAVVGFSLVHETWATNAALATLIDSLGGRSTKVVSPFSSAGANGGEVRGADEDIVFLVGFGQELYGLDTVLKLMRDQRLSAFSWTLIAYGDEKSSAATAERALQAGMQVRTNLDAQQVRAELMRHGVLLRPTSADGDAMVVREALDLGLRVIASDIVPRPAGVELCSLEREDMVRALLNGGTVSDGAGLGVSVADEVTRVVCERTGP